MRWEAANVKESTRKQDDARSGSKKSSETVEAALARLTRSYSAAMNCIGSLHRLASLTEIDDASLKSMQRVANAARSTLERTILIDPLIAETLAPTWRQLVKQHENEERWAFVGDPRPIPPLLTSSSHQSTVRELAYLSLVNYADLLVKACPRAAQEVGEGILNRGVVSHVPQIEWKDEDVTIVQRLVVAALCDASDLDGSDPTVWLKLACAARRLSVVSGECYDRLERHALEQGLTTLPPDVPPNRLIVRALAEHQQEKESCLEYPSKLYAPEDTPSLVLDLPRYSWSILGRMLLKACREGSAYRPHYFSTTEAVQTNFGSPCVVLKLSPMLTLPSETLGTICQYLDSASVWNFEATCRALSASILSARVSMERRGDSNDTAQDRKEEPSTESAAGPSDPPPITKTEPAPGATRMNSALTNTGVGPRSVFNRQTSSGNSEGEDQAASSHRTSKRVQSQRITSGKLAERKAKRNSVEFCFLATLFGFTKDDEKYKAALKEKIDWDDLIPIDFRIQSMPSLDGSPTKAASKQQRGNAGVVARLGDASLMAFINKWSARNSGPLDILSRFLSHVAMNVEEVFAIDSDRPIALAPFVIEAIEALAKRSGYHQGLEPSWYGTRSFNTTGNPQECLEVFSVNLLNAELRLRMCERVSFSNSGYDDDGSVVAVLVPDLLRAADEIETLFPELTENREWLSRKVRLHWLASGFYFWWSRVSQNVRESRQAETRGLEHVSEAIRMLKLPQANPINSVRTPQLESPAHSEQHWTVLSEATLSSFRDELQASSVVSVARESFIEEVEQRVGTLGDEAEGRDLTDHEKARLAEIGSDLLKRYEIPADGTNEKLCELIDDFLETNGDILMETVRDSKKEDGNAPRPWSRIKDLLPSDLPHIDKLLLTPGPSILHVVGVCMHSSGESKLYFLSFLSHLALAGYKHLNTILQKTSEQSHSEDALGDEDDFSDSDDSLASDDAVKNVGEGGESRIEQCTRMMQFLIDKIRDVYKNDQSDEDLSSYPSSSECLALVHFSLAFSADWFRCLTDKTVALKSSLDLDLFLSTQKLVSCLVDSKSFGCQTRPLESVFFGGLARIIVSQREAITEILRPSGGKRMKRAVRQKVCLNRAKYIGGIASEMSYVLSTAPSEIFSGEMKASYLMHGFSLADTGMTEASSMSRLASLSESLLWLWRYMAVNESEESMTVRVSGGTSFDRPIIEALYPPIASLVVGLCGSAITNRILSRQEPIASANGTDRFCVSEFYDSDSSATELVLETGNTESTDVAESKKQMAELLRRICHAAHCIALVSGELNSKVATSYQPPTRCDQEHGPLFPLVVSRVGNHFADILLSEFGAERSPSSRRKNLWATEYPFGVRSIGGIIDFTLYKAYRALHGFTLTGAGAQQAIVGMEHLVLSNDDINPARVVKPESTLAAAQLYRCLLRAYGTVRRKSPPKEALECVASALPALEESERSKVIRAFLFSGQGDYFSHRDVTTLLNREPEQVPPLSAVPDWIWKMEASPGSESVSLPIDQEMEEAMLVRKGICHELAQGPLPLLAAASTDGTKGTKSSKSNAGSQEGEIEERITATSNEEELSKKFDAIVDDLCYGEPVNSKGWYDASMCLTMKADLIADRLGLSKGFSRSKNFHVPTNRVVAESKVDLGDLIDEQEKEYERNSQGWVPYLGNDLSVYIRRQWCSFPSLRECFDEISKNMSNTTTDGSQVDEESYAAHVLQEIASLYDKFDYIGWQQAWGGLFVGALRKMALRCLYVALYLLRREEPGQLSESFFTAEIVESLGVSYYSQLMGSQMYGYPMHVMSDHLKRQLAETSRTCFQFAIDASSSAGIDENEEPQQTWDLLFMKGKCHEKIASTYKKESFRDKQHESEPTRAYERHMKQALQDYVASYDEAKVINEDGGLGEIHGGGSSHGLTEVFYRIHATRLKCLLSAVSQREVDRDAAELEALRLTTLHWFHPPSSEADSSDIRGRVWAVLADVVAAMAQCRIDQAFFHRSVYHHAQALMWAPVLDDPVLGTANGSLGTVSITKGHLLRGLNSTMPSANCVEAILSPLFEKKRPQICAVWVTNASVAQSPFELLNNSLRKYDSLRGKYISAYIDTLRLCKQKGKIEALLQTITSSPRDLPSLFQASALAKGGQPELPHTKESLLAKGRSLVSSGFLRSMKRKVNSALATIILDDIATSNDSKAQSEALKVAYACFLRLNCSVDDLCQTRAWKFGQASIPEADALCQAYLARKDHKDVHAETSNWVGGSQKNAVLKAAVKKCKELFPQMEKELYGKRNKARSRSKTKATDSAPTTEAPASNRKRKEPDAAETFTVTVPDDLSAGDKFETTVQLADGSNKKIRLTVPAGNPQKLQFSLAAPLAEEKPPGI